MTKELLLKPGFKDIVLEPEDVVSAIVKQVVSGRSGQLFLPHVPMWAVATMRSWPAWLQQRLRNHVAYQLEGVRL